MRLITSKAACRPVSPWMKVVKLPSYSGCEPILSFFGDLCAFTPDLCLCLTIEVLQTPVLVEIHSIDQILNLNDKSPTGYNNEKTLHVRGMGKRGKPHADASTRSKNVIELKPYCASVTTQKQWFIPLPLKRGKPSRCAE